MKPTPIILVTTAAAAATPDGVGCRPLLAAVWHWLGAGLAAGLMLVALLSLAVHLWLGRLSRPRREARDEAEGAARDGSGPLHACEDYPQQDWTALRVPRREPLWVRVLAPLGRLLRRASGEHLPPRDQNETR